MLSPTTTYPTREAAMSAVMADLSARQAAEDARRAADYQAANSWRNPRAVVSALASLLCVVALVIWLLRRR
jgi:hypothetical protein